MYFPHAYQKMLLATAGIVATGNTPTIQLEAAQLGVIDAKTNKTIALGTPGDYQTTPMIYLAQGSLHKAPGSNVGDKIGPLHGGYNESVKTKGINPKYISRFYVVEPHPEQVAKVKVTVVGAQSEFKPDTFYRLRVDVKGTGVLRVLGHQFYRTYDANTMCQADGSIDLAGLLVQWKDAINADNVGNQFIKASIVNGELVIEDILVETKFSDATYTRHDWVDHEKIRILTSVWDEVHEACSPVLFGQAVVQDPKQAVGYSGDTVLKEFILSQRYIQEPFQDDLRLREALQDKTFGAINRNTPYVVYHILHSIPKTSNGNSHLESDQYLLKIVVSARNNAFETFLQSLIESAGNAVNLEVL